MRIFDVYRGEQVGAGAKSLALRLEFRAPDRTLTDEDVAERRAAIEGELGEASAGGCVPTGSPSLGAAGFAGALCAALVQRHPSLELTLVTARTDAGRRLDDLYPRYRRAAGARGATTPTGSPSGPTPRWSPTRTAPPRRSSRTCSSAA